MTIITVAVCGPTTVDFEGMRDLQGVLSWAGLKGDVSFSMGPAGSLIKAPRGPGFECMTIEEFASCDPSEFETTFTEEWTYSEQVEDDGNGNRDAVANQNPPL